MNFMSKIYNLSIISRKYCAMKIICKIGNIYQVEGKTVEFRVDLREVEDSSISSRNRTTFEGEEDESAVRRDPRFGRTSTVEVRLDSSLLLRDDTCRGGFGGDAKVRFELRADSFGFSVESFGESVVAFELKSGPFET